MSGEETEIRCPHCKAIVRVTPEWRLVQCAKCGGQITRMDADPSFD